MPSERELPRGRRRDFVEELFDHYRAAHRPTLREISDRIAANEDLTGMTSRETIRLMLKGRTIPGQWAMVYAVAAALSELSGRDLASERWPDGDSYDGSFTYVEALERAWHEALDEEPSTPGTPVQSNDPWSSPAGGYGGEAPF
jgi:hypothetical protein